MPNVLKHPKSAIEMRYRSVQARHALDRAHRGGDPGHVKILLHKSYMLERALHYDKPMDPVFKLAMRFCVDDVCDEYLL